ncbi:MAG: MBL fold metallo-hydrolase [bacterium]
MKLTILGSGTCVPTVKRASPANYLEIGKVKALVDCGSGTLRQIIKAGLDYKNIDIVFFTHFHTDHVLDLNALIQALNWTPRFDRKKDLILIGPIGFKKFYKAFLKLVSGIPRLNTYKIKIKEIKKKLFFENFSVECIKTVHSDASIAYKFIEKGKTLVISGDCDYDNKLAVFSKNVDLLILECSFPNKMKSNGHLIPKECGLIAQKAKAKKLIITHLYPTFSDLIKLNQTKKIFKNTILAEDLMKIKI